MDRASDITRFGAIPGTVEQVSTVIVAFMAATVAAEKVEDGLRNAEESLPEMSKVPILQTAPNPACTKAEIAEPMPPKVTAPGQGARQTAESPVEKQQVQSGVQHLPQENVRVRQSLLRDQPPERGQREAPPAAAANMELHRVKPHAHKCHLTFASNSETRQGVEP